jgi:hypothetical protein
MVIMLIGRYGRQADVAVQIDNWLPEITRPTADNDAAQGVSIPTRLVKVVSQLRA